MHPPGSLASRLQTPVSTGRRAKPTTRRPAEGTLQRPRSVRASRCQTPTECLLLTGLRAAGDDDDVEPGAHRGVEEPGRPVRQAAQLDEVVQPCRAYDKLPDVHGSEVHICELYV